MNRIRKTVASVLAAATLAGAGYFAPISAANAQGYYSPGNGYYGKPYYAPPPRYVYKPRCRWERYRYRNPYGYGWLWDRRWVCK